MWLGSLTTVFVLGHFAFANVLTLNSDGAYPKEWWQEIPRSEAKWWEILPQEAGRGEVILSKRTELGIFSNFAETPFELDGVTYNSVEGFWQMMKFPEENQKDPRWSRKVSWPHTRGEVSRMIGVVAKKAGDLGSKNMKTLGIDWVSYQNRRMVYRSAYCKKHCQLIKRAMRAKLKQTPGLRKLLEKTKGLKLRPDHSQGKNPPAAWRYHEIWMEFRDVE